MNTETGSHCFPVILAGGSGTRLWPLSRRDYPKQFLALNGGHTLLQQTALRTTDLGRPATVICSERHRFLTAEQLAEAGFSEADILLEPSARNTAPAIAAAAWHVTEQDPDGIMIVMPADHQMLETEAFRARITIATEAARSGHLVLLGIEPTQAETGYGYIVANSNRRAGEALFIDRFVEKPEVAVAEQLIASGSCFWNAGIFIFKASVYLDEMAKLAPESHKHSQVAHANATRDLDFIRLGSDFERCSDISIDVAIMEKTNRAVVIPAAFSWSDIGSWESLHAATNQDENGNALIGDVVQLGCKNSYLRAGSRLLAVCGLENITVIETPDTVMVVNLNQSQSVRDLVTHLMQVGRSELIEHRTVYRPWGHYDSLNHGTRFQVKRITVKPDATLSLQKHYHRAEHWVVVSGTAVVTVNDSQVQLTENESTFIPLGAVHRLHNPGRIPLELIEVQSGSYLGEDDIVRIGDEYGRA